MPFQTFGKTKYKGMQREVMEAALDGKDVLVIAPTGMGKVRDNLILGFPFSASSCSNESAISSHPESLLSGSCSGGASWNDNCCQSIIVYVALNICLVPSLVNREETMGLMYSQV